MKRSAQRAGLVVTVASALALAACGGDATVENDDVSSVDPVTGSSESAETSGSETEAESESEESTTPGATSHGGGAPAEPQPEDGAAEEIEEIPEQSPQRSPEAEALLSEVGDGGIDTAGVEDQIIGAASTVCDPEGQDGGNVIVPAAAGQLVEQGKTDLSPEEAASLIESAAQSAYC